MGQNGRKTVEGQASKSRKVEGSKNPPIQNPESRIPNPKSQIRNSPAENALHYLEDQRDLQLLYEMNGPTCAAKQWRQLRRYQTESSAFIDRAFKLLRERRRHTAARLIRGVREARAAFAPHP